MNPGFSVFHPHIGGFLRTDLGFSAICPHIGGFLRMNPGFSVFHPHIGGFLRMNTGFPVLHSCLRRFLHVVDVTSGLLPLQRIGSLGIQKSSRFFVVATIGIHGIDPHVRQFLRRCFTHLCVRNMLELFVTYTKNDFIVGHSFK
jgi:hypothetical protein